MLAERLNRPRTAQTPHGCPNDGHYWGDPNPERDLIFVQTTRCRCQLPSPPPSRAAVTLRSTSHAEPLCVFLASWRIVVQLLEITITDPTPNCRRRRLLREIVAQMCDTRSYNTSSHGDTSLWLSCTTRYARSKDFPRSDSLGAHPEIAPIREPMKSDILTSLEHINMYPP